MGERPNAIRAFIAGWREGWQEETRRMRRILAFIDNVIAAILIGVYLFVRALWTLIAASSIFILVAAITVPIARIVWRDGGVAAYILLGADVAIAFVLGSRAISILRKGGFLAGGDARGQTLSAWLRLVALDAARKEKGK